MSYDQWLERALRAPEAHLADDGFMLRVMASLPPVRAHRVARRDWPTRCGARSPDASVHEARMRCPEVLRQLQRIPRVEIRDHGPEILFQILRPGRTASRIAA